MADRLSPQRIKEIVEGTFPEEYWAPKIQAFFGADASFYLPTLQQLQHVIDDQLKSGNNTLGDGFDCDDYAYALKGCVGLWNRKYGQIQTSWCVGVIFARFKWVKDQEHAANWFIDRSGVLQLIEPQTKQMYEASVVAKGSIKLILL